MTIVERYSGFFFDFDGVIVESNSIKDSAFDMIFRRYPEHYDIMYRYHKAHNAVSRNEKFRYICRNILKHGNADDLARKLSVEFNQLTLNRIIEAPFVPGAEVLLEELMATDKPVWLCSATPEIELVSILEAKGLKKFFHRIHGAEVEKTVALRSMLSVCGLSATSICYFGDSPEDLHAARKIGVDFIGIPGNTDFSGEEIHVIENFNELEKYV